MTAERTTSLASGVFTALVTPFLASGEIDESAFEALVKRQIQAGISGVIPCGTTGEAPTLSEEEKKKLISICVRLCKGTQTRVYAGTGSNNTAETIRLSRWASDAGVTGVLIVTPYYNKPSQAGLIAHYEAVAEALPLTTDLMIYNVPGRTSVSLSAETLGHLSKNPKIRSLKEATGNLAFLSEVRSAVQSSLGKFSLLSGDDPTYYPFLTLGGSGVVSVTSNVVPEQMVALQSAHEAHDANTARALHEKLFPLFKDLFVETNPTPVKYALSLLKLCRANVRLPLVEPTPASQKKVLAALKLAGVSF